MPTSGDKSRILIADEDPVARLTLFHFLAQAGYDVVVAETGDEAISELRKSDHPPVAILHPKLPGMSGTEICKRIREAGRFVHVILSSDSPSSSEIVAGLDIGADQYVTKATPPEELLAHVKVGLRIIARLRALAHKRGTSEESEPSL